MSVATDQWLQAAEQVWLDAAPGRSEEIEAKREEHGQDWRIYLGGYWRGILGETTCLHMPLVLHNDGRAKVWDEGREAGLRVSVR